MSGQKWRTCRLTASCARSSFTHKLQHPPCRGRPEPRRERSGLGIEHLPGRLCFVERVSRIQTSPPSPISTLSNVGTWSPRGAVPPRGPRVLDDILDATLAPLTASGESGQVPGSPPREGSPPRDTRAGG
jgi:hypothetical protein